MDLRTTNRVTIITGASSGIGAALARRLAVRAGAVLGLTGRDAARLGAVAAECRARGAEVEVAHLDARDRAGMAEWLHGFDARHPIDCVIANAGVAAGALEGGHPERGNQIYEVFDINLGGTLNLVMPVLPLMQQRQRGQVVLLSSLAAYAPLPDAAAYSASKAAVLTFGLSLRQLVARDGVHINIVCPGFVTTPMSASFHGWKPFEITADAAAERIERGMTRNARVIAFPWPLAAVSRVVPFVPESVVAAAMRFFTVLGRSHQVGNRRS